MTRRTEPGVPGSIPLGHWRGVEVFAHWSVVVTVGLFASVLGGATLPQAHPGNTRTAYWVVAVCTAVAFLLALLAHELAHALVARGHGMKVKRITLWLLGGVTELGSPSPNARVDALVAIAGPLTSLGIGALTGLLALWVGSSSLVGTALFWLASVNVLLAVFNLLPGAPLDGGRVLRAALWWRYQDRDRAALHAARAGRVLGYVLATLGVLEALAGFAGGLWLVLVGWFIVTGANAEQAATGDERLAGLTAADVMTPAPVVAPAWWTVEQLVEHLSPGRVATGVFPVIDLEGGTAGLCTLADLESVPVTHRVTTQLGTLTARHGRPITVAAQADAVEVAAQVRSHGGLVVVEEANRPVGLISVAELTRAAHLSLLGWRVAPHRP